MDVQIRDAKVSKEKIICEKFAVFKDCVYLCTAFPKKCIQDRDLAQLVAHTSGGREVAGSSPVIPTKNNLTAFKQGGFVFVGGQTVGGKSVKTEN